MFSKRLPLFFLSVLIAILLIGCGSGSSSSSFSPAPTVSPTPTPAPPLPAPTVSPTPTPTPPTPTPTPTASPTPTPTPTPVSLVPSRLVYGIIDFEDDGFFGGKIDSSSGTVSPLSGNPFANTLGQNIVLQVLADPKGRFFYTLNSGASSFGNTIGVPGIGEYKINRSTGALSPVPNGKILKISAGLMAIEGTGRFLYKPHSPGIDIYSIDQSTGLLIAMGSSPSAVPVRNFSAASPDGHYYLNEGDNALAVFAVNQSTGQLTLTGPAVPTQGSGGPLAVSADSRFVYVANVHEGTVAVFSIAPGGEVAPIAGSPFRADTEALGMSLTPDGKFLYMIFGTPSGPCHLLGFAVDPASGSFLPVPAASIASAFTVNVDGSGKFAYISEDLELVTYAIDPATGALTPLSRTSRPRSDIPSDMILTP